MKNIVKEISNNGLTAKIFVDEFPENPRTAFYNLGTMVCFHRRCTFGDKNTGYKHSDFDSFSDMKKGIEKNEKGAIMLPVYLMDHSGQSVQTTPFSCSWDSGQIGFIFVSKEKVREEYKVKRVTKKLEAQVLELLKAEVETYNQFLTGEVYGYEIKDSEGKDFDSCYGFFGLKHVEDEVNTLLCFTSQTV